MAASSATRILVLVLTVCLGVLGGGAALAFQDEGNRHFDARIAVEARHSTAEAEAAAAALRKEMPDLMVEYDAATGVADSVYVPGGYLSGPNVGADPLAVAREWTEEHKDLLGLSSADLADFEVTDHVYSRVSGTTHLYLRQVYKGLPLYNGQLQVNLDRDLRVVSVNNSFLPDLALSVDSTEPRIGAAEAVLAAAEHLGIETVRSPAAEELSSGPERLTRVDPAGISQEKIEARLMLLPVQRGEARLVWSFQVYTEDGEHAYDLTVDAGDGKVWTSFDWVAAASYKVYPRPVESPNHTAPLPPADARVVVNNPAHPFSSAFGWHDTNGVVGAEFTNMRGNNVHAYDDIDANNLPPAIEPNCGAGLNCNFAINLAGAPNTYTPAAVANLFYWNNVIHDVQMLYGFDSAAGNFQVNTYAAGGAGNDDVRAEAQDGGGINNANFFTPPDGLRPRMQMFLWNTSVPAKDGDLDDLIIVHEYGHGISNRLVGGPAIVNCLTNLQQPGEGLSDWWGLVYTHKPGALGTDPRGVGTYALSQPTNGPGVRAQRYSTDPLVNTWTYASIATMAPPHGVGSVWAQGAWEAYWALVNFWGFDPNLYFTFGGAGNQRMMLYVNEGLKLTACNPTFTQVRDGIIQAATVNYGGIDVCRLWVAFANYGLGSNANPVGPNNLNVTNGFMVPAACRTDAWSKDKPWDTGLEPDPATAANNMWESEDIWVRNDATPGPHQNPEFGQTNFVWVKVRNRSAVEAVDVPVKVYVANASTGLAWPANWTQIGTAMIGSLAPGAETEITLPWNPPGTGHFCLLSRIDTVQDPMTFAETINVNFNTRQNNNIVWKNVNIVNLIPGFSPVPVRFNVRNHLGSPRLRLRFRESAEGIEQRGAAFLERGRVMVVLDDLLAERFAEEGQPQDGFELVDDRTLVAVTPDAFLEVSTAPGEEYEVEILFEDTGGTGTGEAAADDEFESYFYEVVQEDADTNEVQGGITYDVRVPPL